MATVTRTLENPLALVPEGRSSLSQRERREPHASASGAAFAALLSSLSTTAPAAVPASHEFGGAKKKSSADSVKKIDGAETEIAAPQLGGFDASKFDSALPATGSFGPHPDITGNPDADLYDFAAPQPPLTSTPAPDFPSHAEQASPGLSYPPDHPRNAGHALAGNLGLVADDAPIQVSEFPSPPVQTGASFAPGGPAMTEASETDTRREPAPHPSAGNVGGYSQAERPGALSAPLNQAAYVPVQQVRQVRPWIGTYDAPADLSAGEPALHPSRRRESEASAMPSAPSSAEGAASEPSRVEASEARPAAWVDLVESRGNEQIAVVRVDVGRAAGARAVVSERANSINARMTTSSDQSAQLLSASIPALRRALESIGVNPNRLSASADGHAPDRGAGREPAEQPDRRSKENGQVFVTREVN
jgi:hypothetical protein